MSLVEDLKKKTVFELKSYAKTNNIDIVGSNTKNEILEVIFNFVPVEEFSKDNEKTKDVENKAKSTEKIALYAKRNVHWTDVGVLKQGYNIVPKEDSEKWLTQKSVRLATPEEVATYYGKA